MGFLAALPLVDAALNFLGARSANNKAGDEARANRQLQMDTLHNQIQWRVEDAKKAGIHPLYALGATPYSYSPASTAFTATGSGDAFSQVGQNIERARIAGMSQRERAEAAAQAIIRQKQESVIFNLQAENMALENDKLRSQIAQLNSPGTGPGVSTAAPGSVNINPDNVVVGSVGEPARSPGEVTDYSFQAQPGGRYGIVPSYDTKQRIEDMPSEWQWFLRNGLLPNDNVFRELERQHPSRAGHEWRYDPVMGSFWQRPLRGRRRHY